MSREEELIVGEVIACSGSRLVSVLRLTANRVGPWTSADAELVGVVVVPPAGAIVFVPSDATPPDAASWNEWLIARPQLLEQLRARLDV